MFLINCLVFSMTPLGNYLYEKEDLRIMLKTRQKFLIEFLNLAKTCSKLKLAKIFFIIDREGTLGQLFKFYKFVPYKYGPYSFELFHDIEMLEKNNDIFIDDKNINYLKPESNVNSNYSKILDNYIKKYANKSETELIEYIYQKYPGYTIFSEISQKKDYKRNIKGILSIGYQGLSIDEFLMKLIEEKVQILIDVRNNPWSMKFGFNKHNLKRFCEHLGIRYLSWPSLGIPNKFRKNLVTQEDYKSLFKRYKKSLMNKDKELEEINRLSKKNRIAVMCFEQDPEFCHRTIILEELTKKESGC